MTERTICEETHLVDFNTHASFYSSSFLLRVPVFLNQNLVKITSLKHRPVFTLEYSSTSISIPLADFFEKVTCILKRHSVYHVSGFYHDRVPLFSLIFASESSLKQFLSEANAMQSKLESAFAEKIILSIAKSSTALEPRSPSSIPVEIRQMELHFLSPDNEDKGKAKVCKVTLTNYRYCINSWRESKLFDFLSIFQDQAEFAEVEDLCKELMEISDWFYFGLNLGVPESKLLNIYHGHKQGRLSSKCLSHMLQEWKKLETPTWNKVVTALMAVGRPALAQHIARKYDCDTPLPESIQNKALQMISHTTATATIKKGAHSAKWQQLAATIEEMQKHPDPMEHELQQKQRDLTRVLFDKTKSDLEEEKLKTEIAHYRVKSTELDQEIRELDNQLSLKRQELKLLQTVEMDESKWIIENKNMEIKRLEEQLEHAKSNLDTNKQGSHRMRKKIRDTVKELSQISSKASRLESEIRQLRHELDKKRKQVDCLLIEMLTSADDESDDKMNLPHSEQQVPPDIGLLGDPFSVEVGHEGKTVALNAHGISLTIPEGAVPEGNKAIIEGQCCVGPFVAPEGYKLASPIYLMSTTCKLKKNVVATVTHFANLQHEEDCAAMAFATAPSVYNDSEGSSPKREYILKPIKCGDDGDKPYRFRPHEQIATVTISHFCFFGILQGSHTGQLYTALFCTPREPLQPTPSAVFSICLCHPKYEKELQQRLKEVLHDTLLVTPQRVCFDSNSPNSVAELIIPHEEIKKQGYRVRTDRPTKISKSEVDFPIKHQMYARSPSLSYPPQVVLTILATDEYGGKRAFLDCTFAVRGVTELSGDECAFFLTLPNGQPTGEFTPVSPDSYGTELEERPKMTEFHLIKWEQQGREKSLNIIETVGERWWELGIFLGISEHSLCGIESQKQRNQTDCCRTVFQRWLDSGSEKYPVTWSGLINAFEDVGLRILAKDLKNAIPRRK